MTRNNLGDILPVTPLQHGLLFHATHDSEDAYTVQIDFALDGPFDSAAAQSALDAIANRHPGLRSGFRSEGLSRPVQLVPDKVQVPWRFTDLTTTAGQTIEALFEAERHERFDLTSPPLLRAHLVRIAPSQYRLALTIHHIVIDGWSMPLLVDELWAGYTAVNGSPLPSMQTSYRQFLQWQAQQDVPAARAAWSLHLADVEEGTLLAGGSLPVAPPRHLLRSVDATTSNRLSQLARRHGVTMTSVVHSAWAVVLATATGRSDAVFGTTVAQRPAEVDGIESMIGLFINTIPVAVGLRWNESISELWRRTHRAATMLLDHQHLGLPEIQAASRVGSLFDTLCVTQNYPLDESVLQRTVGDLTVTDTQVVDSTHYAASLVVTFDPDGIGLNLEHRPDAVCGELASGLMQALVTVLQDFAADPDAAVGRIAVARCLPGAITGSASWAETEMLPLSPAAEQSGEGRAPGDTIAESFFEQAHRTPTAEAISDGKTRLTYAQAAAQARALARRLVASGVRPGDIVAVCIPRCADLVVAILGTLASGAAYLPIDPAYPANRIHDTIVDARPTTILSQAGVDLPETGTPRIDFDPTLAGLDGSHPVLPTVPGEAPAYVIYTSGSTGRPKGVIIAHRNVLRLFDQTYGWFRLGADDVWTLFHSCSFDFSVWEMWGALLYGGRLVVVPYDVSRSPHEFLQLLERERVTVLSQTPSAFAQLDQADADDPGRDLALRAVVFGGEALDLWRLQGWYERHPQSPVLINMYGITETTVHVTYVALNAAAASSDSDTDSIIGKAIPDLQLHVLDAALRPVPAGVVGEIYVGGDGVAQGYLRRPELTASRFVADPFGPSGARLYRSGDLARPNTDGSLNFIGRTDHQVKIRGFRIELGEIEAVLVEHPGVTDAVVIARENGSDVTLVAYVVGSVEDDTLRTHLLSRLPQYMVPTAFIALPTLPLTANGKLDRVALPAPMRRKGEGDPPRDELERIVCSTFADALGVPQVGRTDDFFALGGHSLTAAQVIGKLRTRHALDVPIRCLFDYHTPAELAAQLRAGNERPALRRRPRTERMSLSYGQRRLWFLNQFDDQAASYIMPLGLRLRGSLDADALQAAIRDVVVRHEVLRTRYPDQDGVPYQDILDPADVAVDLPLLDLSSTAETQQRAIVIERATARFDLKADLPIRSVLVRYGEQDHHLLLILHHIAADGSSMKPLAADLSIAYAARLQGRTPEFTPLPVQYADVAAWQETLLDGIDKFPGIADEQLSYWQKRLAGIPPELTLPYDRPRPGRPSGKGETCVIDISPELHRCCQTLADQTGTTLFMVLQTAVATTLARLGAGEDIPLGTVVAGRTEADMSDLVGFFLNTLVLRTEVSVESSFRELLRRVRETDLEAFDHADLPFERLVDAIVGERSIARNPLFQVLVTLETNAPVTFNIEGTSVEAGPIAALGAKFDLSFIFKSRYGAGAGLDLELDYARDLWDEATVSAMGRRLCSVLEAVTVNPDIRVGDINIVEPEEHRVILEEWTGERREVSPDSDVITLFERQAQATPDAVALTVPGESITYAELSTRSNVMAQHFRTQGVGPEVFVAIAMPRRVELVVALLGILKAGGAYVPLDLDYPEQRLAWMVEDTSPRVLVTTSDQAIPVPLAQLKRLNVDHLPMTVGVRLDADVARDPQSPAYVVFTSGSTGRPKGVVITHDALAHYLDWTSRHYAGVMGRTLLHSPISFDLTVTGLFTPLVSGGEVVLAALEGDEDVRALLEAKECTFLKATPSHLPLLSALPAEFTPTKQLLLGGETLVAEALTTLRESRPELIIHNVYGPTETTVNCTENIISVGDDPGTGVLPVGRPFADMDVYVLGPNLELLPPGVTGDIYIAGPQLARGYLERFVLTAERFVANPYGCGGSRMYRSGDLGKWRSDGQLVFMGRADRQIKLRGFRIELGEIEATIVGCPDVAECSVQVREDRPGDQRLVAYVVAVPVHRGDAGVANAVDAACRKSLPEHMVPNHILELDSLPLSPNGKLDRRALPAPEAPTMGAGRAASNPMEEALLKIFQDVLGDRYDGTISVEDSFFELGGDSIMSIQVVSRARRAGIVITPKDVFEKRTVAALTLVAKRLEKDLSKSDDGIGSIPLTPALERFRRRGGPISRFNQATLIYAPGEADEASLLTALQRVLDTHPVLRMRLDRDSGAGFKLETRPVGSVSATDCFTRVDASGCDADAMERLLASEGNLAWDRTEPVDGRMFQVVWFDAGRDTPGKLLLVAHHLLVDGLSWHILVEDFREAWRNALDPSEPGPAAPGTSFLRWAEIQQHAAYQPAQTEQLPYWCSVLDEMDPLLGVRPLDPTQDTMGEVEYLEETLPPADTRPLLAEVTTAFRASVNDILLTALAISVQESRTAVGDDAGSVLVDLESHGRMGEVVDESIDLTRTVGWFTVRYPVRLEPRAAVPGSLPAAVGDVRAALARVPQDGLAFGLLRYINKDTESQLAEYLDPEISFNYLGRTESSTDAASRPWTAVSGTAGLVTNRPNPLTPLTHTLSVNAITQDSPDGPSLLLVWSWPRGLLTREDIQGLLDRYIAVLRAMVAAAAAGQQRAFDASDVSSVAISQDDLEFLSADLASTTGLVASADPSTDSDEWETF